MFICVRAFRCVRDDPESTLPLPNGKFQSVNSSYFLFPNIFLPVTYSLKLPLAQQPHSKQILEISAREKKVVWEDFSWAVCNKRDDSPCLDEHSKSSGKDFFAIMTQTESEKRKSLMTAWIEELHQTLQYHQCVLNSINLLARFFFLEGMNILKRRFDVSFGSGQCENMISSA